MTHHPWHSSLEGLNLPKRGYGRLSDHPRVSEVMDPIATDIQRNTWHFDIDLVPDQRYMINNCLGIKVSSGKFSIDINDAIYRIEPEGIVWTIRIPHISFNALTIRARPNPSHILKPCTFGGRFEIGGTASNVRITIRYNPHIDLTGCRLKGLGDIDIHVRIGGLNLKPLQNNLDTVAKNMIEDALTHALSMDMPSQMSARMGIFPSGFCADRVFLYRLYMEILSEGVTMHKLPKSYVKKFKEHYPNADLTKVEFGYSNRQTSGNATTDCTRIYFNDKKYVNWIINEELELDKACTEDDKAGAGWLYHELRHVEQCSEWGGRDSYAERWFRDVDITILLNLLRLTSGASMRNLHDWMPMEAEAISREDKVLAAFRAAPPP